MFLEDGFFPPRRMNPEQNTSRLRFNPLSILWVVGVAAIYSVAARLSLFLAIPPGNATPVWPPSGIALAAVLLLGYRVLPGIWLGATLANAMTKVSLAAAVSIGVGNTLEALLEAYLLQRFAGDRNPFHRGRDVFVFGAFAGGLSCAVAATTGVSSLWLGGLLPGTALALNWWTWWLGDLGGMIAITPLLLTWWENPRLGWDLRRLVEGLALASLFIASSLSIFGNWLPGRTVHSLSYLVLIFLGWTAFRFGPRETATAITMAVGIAIWGTIRGVGPFHADTLNESLLLLQAFVILVGVSGLVMAALVEERRRIEASLRTARNTQEIRVQERTSALAGANDQLQAENTERKRAEAGLALRTRQLEAVRTISEEITRELQLPALLQLITQRAAELVGAAGGAIHLWDEASQLLTLGAWYGQGEWKKAVREDLGKGVVGIVAQRRQGMIVSDYQSWPHALPFLLEHTGVTSMLAEPLLYRDRLLGVIGLDNEKSERVFIEEHRELLSLFASQAAIAIENGIGLSPETWVETVLNFGRWFRRAAGRVESLTAEANKRGRRWLHGLSHCRESFA